MDSYKHTVNLFFAYGLAIVLVYLHYITRSHLNQQIIDQKQHQLDNLTHYTQQIENLYHSLNAFRHDYANLMISLDESIQTNNMAHVRHIYNDVLKNAKIKLQHNDYSLSTLRKVEIPAIKSVLSHKIIYALEKGIRTEIELEQQWTSCHMDTLDYIRILGILLDNAIEASEKNANAFIRIAVITDPIHQENRFIIENATTEEKSPIHQLFKHGVTTKGNNHGTGLHNVQQILIDYEQAHLETAHANHKFSQTLVTQG
ncbi:sensor histidine kinase [Leuconostoc sp. MS02]|uniref:Sensor histidine kinase n=1 Tax=Leuconostoc aquikimchii TaxID=3236804 RepID=A0ABV3S591_9LACO